MNWFKFAKDFSDRNIINSKIRYLKKLREVIAYNSKIVFQSAKTVKESNYNMITSSKITSYPSLHEVLIRADSLVLDSPWRFGELCNDAIKTVDKLLFGLRKKREEITFGEKKKGPKKGLV